MGVIKNGPPRYRHLPEGLYRAKLIRFDGDGIGAYQNQVYEPWFKVVGGSYSDTEVKDMINKNRSEARNSKLCHMIRALKPDLKLEVFDEINLDELMGCECCIKVERRKEKNIAITQYFSISDFEDIK